MSVEENTPSREELLRQFPFLADPELTAPIKYPDEIYEGLSAYYGKLAEETLDDEDKRRIDSVIKRVRNQALSGAEPSTSHTDGDARALGIDEPRLSSKPALHRSRQLGVRVVLAAAAVIVALVVVWQVLSHSQPAWKDDDAVAWLHAQPQLSYTTSDGQRRGLGLLDAAAISGLELPGARGSASENLAPISPALGEFVIGPNPSFFWRTVDGVRFYEVQMLSDGESFAGGLPPDVVQKVEIPDVSPFPKVGFARLSPEKSLPPGTYTWRVVPTSMSRDEQTDVPGLSFQIAGDEERTKVRDAIALADDLQSRAGAPAGISAIVKAQMAIECRMYLLSLEYAESFLASHKSQIGEATAKKIRTHLRFREGATLQSVREDYGLPPDYSFEGPLPPSR
ncbi:MAG: hypothetical protein K8R46_12610 [Pirellulales bacterium]|nr:hypothetical protein [Pirellulales bacterium]